MSKLTAEMLLAVGAVWLLIMLPSSAFGDAPLRVPAVLSAQLP